MDMKKISYSGTGWLVFATGSNLRWELATAAQVWLCVLKTFRHICKWHKIMIKGFQLCNKSRKTCKNLLWEYLNIKSDIYNLLASIASSWASAEFLHNVMPDLLPPCIHALLTHWTFAITSLEINRDAVFTKPEKEAQVDLTCLSSCHVPMQILAS